ncbi:hypothetical protein SAMN04487819_106206 [Actinopolyspora alba]|uniref:IrrE N-terminal-like domain-containing protein n=2 Tax=Actinopolyspora alba TaxID=673379 RepID=A0A1I1WZG3_9ACTN|nr:hypothetical protein SAMN04487819_106206 [Actinopolyspora alba]
MNRCGRVTNNAIMSGTDITIVGVTPWCLRPPDSGSATSGEGSATVDRSDLRVRCRRRVDELIGHIGVPHPWDINDFLDRLEQHRGRDIDLCPIVWTRGDSSGLWQQHADHDVIAYAANTSGFHQDHIILHEVGHMISRHRGHCVLSEQEAQRIAPDLAPAALAHLLDRATGESQEHEAETVASLLHQRARRRPHVAGEAPPVTARRLARVDYIFGE